jgi:iron complex outermembrane recepter protein
MMSNHELGGTTVLAAAVRQCLRASRPRGSAIALTVAAAGLQWGGVGTATAAAASGQGLEEIVVTATRREQSVQEIPFNISAMSGDILSTGVISDQVEALRMLPGVSMLDRGYRNSGMAGSVIIRGINVDGAANGDVPLAAPTAVAVYIDDTALNSNFVLKDVERVEVLRGPQGTLYGSGSLAGNVRYIMNKPDPSAFNGWVSVNTGKTDGSGGYNFNPDAMLNVPLGDALAFRVSAGMIDNAGIIDYPNVYKKDANGVPIPANGDIVTGTPVYKTVKDADTVNLKYARAAALWSSGDDFSAQLSYMWQDDHTGGRRQVSTGINEVTGQKYKDYQYGAVQKEPSDREVQLTALEMEVGLGFATLTSSTSYSGENGVGNSDNSGYYARNGWFYYYGSSPRPIDKANRFYNQSAFTEEIRLLSKGGEFVDWLAGLYYTNQDSKLGQNSYLVGYIPYLNAIDWYGLAPYTTDQDFLFRRKQQYDETALYGEMTLNFTDDLHLTLGGRWFDSNVDVNAKVDIPIWDPSGASAGIAKENQSENDFLFRGNFAWDVADHAMLYATFSQGYRHGGANAVPTSGHYAENPAFLTFKSDTVNNYEVGFKGATDALNYTVSLFYADWNNPQLNTATSNWGFFAVVNGKTASTQGIELELSGHINDQFSYMLGYSYTDAKLTGNVYQPAGNLFGNGAYYNDMVGKDGGRLPGAAENMLSGSLMFNTTLGHDVGFNAVLSGYYQSGIVNTIGNGDCQIGYYTEANTTPGFAGGGWRVGNCKDSANPASVNYAPTSVFNRQFAKIDSFQIWNLSGNFTWESWNASIYAKNIFNDKGSTGTFTYLAGGANTDPSQQFYGSQQRDYIALPRTFGLVIGYKF